MEGLTKDPFPSLMKLIKDPFHSRRVILKTIYKFKTSSKIKIILKCLPHPSIKRKKKLPHKNLYKRKRRIPRKKSREI